MTEMIINYGSSLCPLFLLKYPDDPNDQRTMCLGSRRDRFILAEGPGGESEYAVTKIAHMLMKQVIAGQK